jgi:Flp pilus assembly protein TadD
MVLYHAGRGESAVARLNEAVKLDPKFALAYGALGDVLYSQFRQAEGYQAYQKSLELGAENRLTKREDDQIRGMRAIDTGEFEVAVEAFRDLAADYPRDSSAWTYPTIPLRMLGRDEEAISNLKHAMALTPGAPFPPYAIAQELMILGRMDEAAKWVEFSRAHGFVDDTNENEGIYRYLYADYPAAEKSFRALRQSTNNESRSTGCLLLASLYAETGQEQKAMDILTEGIHEDAAQKNFDGQSTKLLARAYVEANHRQLSQALADEHAGYAMSSAPNHALTAEMVLGAVELNSNREFQSRLKESLLEIQHARSTESGGRMSDLVRLLNEGELDLVEDRTEAGVTKMRTAALLDAPALHSDFLVQGLAIAARSNARPSPMQFGHEAALHATSLLQHQSAFLVSYARFLPGVVSETEKIASEFQIQTTKVQKRR